MALESSQAADLKTTAVVPFSPEHLPAVREFCEVHLRRPQSDDYFEWRYLSSRPFSRMVVALRGDECLGMLFALRKRYRINGTLTPCLEVFDWHCSPEMQGTGMGIRLMRAMMKHPEWIIAVSGTVEANSVLALMGWRTIGKSQLYDLPVTNRMLAPETRNGHPRSMGRTLMGVLSTALTPPHRRAPSAGRVTRAPILSEEVQQLYADKTGYGLVALPESEHLGWVTSGGWSGKFEILTFAVAGQLRGWALTRVYNWGLGLDGDIVDLFAPEPSVGLYSWMVSEATKSLMPSRPRRIRTRASCPILRSALLANGFLRLGSENAANIRPVGSGFKGGPVHITLNSSDGPLLPYQIGSQVVE